MGVIKKIGVMTSGGDSPGMNAAIRAVVRASVYYNKKICGIKGGYDGLISGNLVSLDARSVKNIIHRGGTILKSARSKEFRTSEGRKQAFDVVQKHEIDALVVIGGDGSFTGASVFEDEFNIPCIGIPGTIDNDIYGTDYTIGFDTAVNTVVDAVDMIRNTASSHSRLFFIEVMGRDAGHIAIHAGIAAGTEEVLIPEQNLGVERLIKSLERSSRAGKSSSLVIVAEGDKSGGAYELARIVQEKLPQYDTKVSVLGHIQRGGNPTYFDRVLASRMGVEAVEALLAGKSNIMVGIQNKKLVHVGLEVAIKQDPDIDRELLRIADIVSI
jgi:6-phosphofructokinase 1